MDHPLNTPCVFLLYSLRDKEYFIGTAESYVMVRATWNNNNCVTMGFKHRILQEFDKHTPMRVAEERAEYYANKLGVTKILDTLGTQSHK